jgi:hypothetical protein
MEEMAEPVHFIPQQSQLTSPTFDHTRGGAELPLRSDAADIIGSVRMTIGGS